MSTVSVSFRPLMEFLPPPRFTWRLHRKDGILQGFLMGHEGIGFTKAAGEKMFTCTRAGGDSYMPTLDTALLWCEHNLSGTRT